MGARAIIDDYGGAGALGVAGLWLTTVRERTVGGSRAHTVLTSARSLGAHNVPPPRTHTHHQSL
jgi:hypothetical protein